MDWNPRRSVRHEAEYVRRPSGWTGIPGVPSATRSNISVVLQGGQESQASRLPRCRAFPSCFRVDKSPRAFPPAFRVDRNPRRGIRHEAEHFRRPVGWTGISGVPSAAKPSISFVLQGAQESQAYHPRRGRTSGRNPRRSVRHEAEHFRRPSGLTGFPGVPSATRPKIPVVF